MTAIPTIAAIRFGSGLSPRHAAPADAAALLQGLAGPDLGVADYPNPTYEDTLPLAQRYKAERAERRTLGAAARAAGAGQAARDAEKLAARQLLQVRRKLEANYTAAAMRTLARAVDAVTPSDGFRERLVQFWADHFTVRSKNSYEREGPSAYVDAAIRPHVTGRFGDMLEAAALHPVMLIYLDQVSSFGPNSAFALRHKRGLNENLAREILELHALGVGGGYSRRMSGPLPNC